MTKIKNFQDFVRQNLNTLPVTFHNYSCTDYSLAKNKKILRLLRPRSIHIKAYCSHKCSPIRYYKPISKPFKLNESSQIDG